MPSECYCKVLKLLFVRFVLNSPAMKTFTVYVIFLVFLCFFVVVFSGNLGNPGKLPLAFIAAASGGGAFLLIIVAVICFACVVRGRRLVGTT